MEQTKGLTVGILTVLEDDANAAPQHVVSVAVVVEEEIILQDLPDLPTAFAYLFGLIYALNLEYPKDLRYTFETVQKVFMELGADLSARVRSLKNKLLQWIHKLTDNARSLLTSEHHANLVFLLLSNLMYLELPLSYICFALY